MPASIVRIVRSTYRKRHNLAMFDMFMGNKQLLQVGKTLLICSILALLILSTRKAYIYKMLMNLYCGRCVSASFADETKRKCSVCSVDTYIIRLASAYLNICAQIIIITGTRERETV